MSNVNLTFEQEEIVKLNAEDHIVLAPPGTGKTEMLSHRVLYALENGMKSEKMICLTFTNRAVKEMQERVAEKIGEETTRQIFIGTIHNYCYNFLSHNNLISKYTSLMDEDDQKRLMIEAKSLTDADSQLKTDGLIRVNTRIKQHSLGFPDKIKSPLNDDDSPYESDKNNIEICFKYEELKSHYFLLDFDDLLTITYNYLWKGNDNFEMINYDWVQVDEVQDLNMLQWAIIFRLSSKKSHKVYFGDYEQAIFSFTGAKLENLHKIANTCIKHNLQRNFRSPSYLIKIYVDFAKAHLNPSWRKDPFANEEKKPSEDDLLTTRHPGTEKEEALFNVKYIVPRFLKYKREQTAILVRYNSSADIYSGYLDNKGISHFCVSGFDLFHRELTKDVMSFLACLSNKFARESWVRLIKIFAGLKTLKESREFIHDMYLNHLSPVDLLIEDSNLLKNFNIAYNNKRIVVFDTETTGLDTDNDDIIQIAAKEIINGVPGDEFEVYLKTDKEIGASEKVHNISSDKLKQLGKDRQEALNAFLDFVGNDILAAHNFNFDWNILTTNLLREGLITNEEDIKISDEKYDTLELSRTLYPLFSSHKLEYLIDKLDIEGVNSHNAMDDVRATVNLAKKLVEDYIKIKPMQNEFMEINSNAIEKFKKSFGPLYVELINSYNQSTTFSKVIDKFINLLKQQTNYKVDTNDLKQLQKLKRHMEEKVGVQKLSELIFKYFPGYRTYKESDLILESDSLIISTVHKAKGLGFDNILIPGCVDDVYPHFKSSTEAQIREDARTLYVALSRSKKRICITSYSSFISKWGKEYRKDESPFLDPIKKYFHRFT